MQTLDKVRDETRDRVPRPSAPKRIAARAGKGATKGSAKGAGKAGKGVFSRIAAAVTDLAKGLTGRKQAERRRRRRRHGCCRRRGDRDRRRGPLPGEAQSRRLQGSAAAGPARGLRTSGPQPEPERPDRRRHLRNGQHPRLAVRVRSAAARAAGAPEWIAMSEEVKSSIEIGAPAARVWDVVMDPARLGDWVSAPQGRRVEGGRPPRGGRLASSRRCGSAGPTPGSNGPLSRSSARGARCGAAAARLARAPT